MIRTYKIAETSMQIEIPFPYYEMEEFGQYRVADAEADVKIRFVFSDWTVPEGYPSFQIGLKKITEADGTYYVELLDGEQESCFGCMVLPASGQKEYICYLNNTAQANLPNSPRIFHAISFDHILNRNQTYLLHASYVRWREMAILFSGPSGMGKTTQAALWERYENAELINGDRVAVHKHQKIWNAYGLPYAGSSEIFKNVTSPIGIIVVLRQGSENEIDRLDEMAAFKYLYSEVLIHTWDRNYLELVMDMLTDTAKSVPVYLLTCKPDESAVKLLKREMEKLDGFGTE